MDLRRALFSFKGRMRRRDWWAFTLGLLVLETVVIKGLELAIAGPSGDLLQGNVFSWLFARSLTPTMFWIEAVVMLALAWPNLAVTTQRAHDRGNAGYWVNGVLVAAYASFFLPPDWALRAGAALDRGDWIGGLPLVWEAALVLGIIATLVVLGFLDGNPAPNRYGPSPKHGSQADLGEVFD